MNVDNYARRWVDRRNFFDSQNGLKELPTLAAVLFWNVNAHQAEREKLVDDVLAEDACIVHLADVGCDLLAREVAHGGLEHLFFFSEDRKGLWSFSQSRGRHGVPFFDCMPQ